MVEPWFVVVIKVCIVVGKGHTVVVRVIDIGVLGNKRVMARL